MSVLTKESITYSRELYFAAKEEDFKGECGQIAWDYIRVIRALHDTIAAQAKRIEELEKLLQKVDDNIGWHGYGSKSKDEFYCEHCYADSSADSANIKHENGCL